MPTSSATDLKRRLEHARRRQREVAQGRVQDESGVRALERDPVTPPASPAHSAAPVVDARPVLVRDSNLMSVVRRVPWRAGLLLLAGALIGAWFARLAPSAPTFVVGLRGVAATPAAEPAPSSGPGGSHHTVQALPDGLDLRSNPAGAEVVVHGAVVANTPARVPRPAYPALYLLRRSGYHPQLVRVLPQSGDVVVDLRPLSEELPGPSSTQGPRTKRKPDRGRGHDVGRQPAPGRSDGLVVGSSAR